MIKVGAADITGITLGDTEISKAYLGGDIVFQKDSPLPYDAEIEYLQGTGTQYIDTLFYPRITNTDITVEVKFNKNVLNGDHCVLGARTGAGGDQGYFNPLIADGVHLSQHGQDIVSDLLCGFIKSLF